MNNYETVKKLFTETCELCGESHNVHYLNGQRLHYHCYLNVLENFVDHGLLTELERNQKRAAAYVAIQGGLV